MYGILGRWGEIEREAKMGEMGHHVRRPVPRVYVFSVADGRELRERLSTSLPARDLIKLLACCSGCAG